ncbi:hypothetical protein MLD38_018214 [Melastoma candidum]|uniref:Uncharacterized protein n=1 Tax=Melastoma candidum TaxID=119954 RepID=A0ACB9QT34_9MYRT|nr:hypothetical protein MLD38_018214 [Melastoma candidum]
MASTSAPSSALSLPPSSILAEGKAPSRQSPQSIPLPSLPPPSQSWSWKQPTLYCRKVARDVMAMATGEVTAEVTSLELSDALRTVKEAWEKVEDKYAVSSLAVAAAVGLVGSSGMISAIDRLPLIPGLLEVVGIGYTGWFAYKNLIFKPDREALVLKLKQLYGDIIGSS